MTISPDLVPGNAIHLSTSALEAGAVVIIHEDRCRLRLLPVGSRT